MKKTFILACFFFSYMIVCAQQMEDISEHSKYISGVDEYRPAPGQFVNTLPLCDDDDTADSMVVKCANAIVGDKNGMITLGAYGGYVTFHFDHSIANLYGERDIFISGNTYQGNSEPGIVMVSKDTNHNGLPDDEWYELIGSADEDSIGKLVYGYEITYHYSPMENVRWTDNRSSEGSVDRNSFHNQEYFPLWLTSENTLTFTGTRLPSNAYNTAEAPRENWVLNSFRYGYVDNKANTDVEANSFDIGWAVDSNRNPVTLDFVDFVRVYCAVNQKCGWLGETSTEVTGAQDLHLQKSIDAIVTSIDDNTLNGNDNNTTVVARYYTDGTKIDSSKKDYTNMNARLSDGRRIVIERMSNGICRKVIVKN